MNRKSFYFRQKVKATELNASFADVDAAFAAFLRGFHYQGIADGAEVTQNAPQNLTVVAAGPALVYDQNQHHIEWFPNQTINCAVDEVGVATAVGTPGFEKWISVFVEASEVLSDPRVDGNGATVYFARTESFKFNVAQGAEASSAAIRPALRLDQVLLADVHLVQGQTQIVNADIDFTRTQYIFDLPGSPASLRARRLHEVLQGMLNVLNAFNASSVAVPAITGSPLSFIAGSVTNVFTQALAFINNITPGALSVDAIPGSPRSTLADSVTGVLGQLLAFINGITSTSISVAAITDSPSSTSAGNLTAVLTELLGFINNIASTLTIAAISDSPLSTASGTVRAVFIQILGFINDNLAHLNRANVFTGKVTATATGAGAAPIDKASIVANGGGTTGIGLYAKGGSSGGEAGYFEGDPGSDSNALFAKGTGDGAGIRAEGGDDGGSAGLFIAHYGGSGHAVEATASGAPATVIGLNVAAGGMAVQAIALDGAGLPGDPGQPAMPTNNGAAVQAIARGNAPAVEAISMGTGAAMTAVAKNDAVGLFSGVEDGVAVMGVATGDGANAAGMNAFGSFVGVGSALGLAVFGSAARASINIGAHGSDPTTRNNGDVWIQGGQIKIMLGGVIKVFAFSE